VLDGLSGNHFLEAADWQLIRKIMKKRKIKKASNPCLEQLLRQDWKDVQ
jgi:succinate dehydrogenase flavin-adding protein (antitoxin of CptAB toxin-antitoxin module)